MVYIYEISKGGRKVILCFHELGNPVNPYCMPINNFKKVIEQNEDELHFDDGRKGILALGDVYLKNIAHRSTIFIVPNFVKNFNVPEHEKYSEFLDYADIEKLIKLGFEIGSHSLTHRDITKTTGYEWKEELIFSKKWLESRFQIKVEKFSWPYGKVNYWLQIEAERIYKYCYTLDSLLGIKRQLVLSQIR